METIILKAESRELMGRATNDLRAENIVPAVLYGAGEEAQNLKVSRSEFDRVYRQAGESTVVQLEINGVQVPVLIHDVQFDPKIDFTAHVDFLRIDMNKPVEAAIELVFIGESHAVHGLGGTLVTSVEEIEVRALPASLVRQIEVDITKLATFDDAIHVSDLNIPEGIEVLTESDVVLATVQPPRDESELEALDAPVEANIDAVEVTTEKKDEEEKATSDSE